MQPANAVPGTSAAAHPLPQPVAPSPGNNASPSQPLLYQACREGDVAAVKRLLAAGGIAVDAIDPDTRLTPLMLATRHGHDDVALVLMKGQQGASVNLQNSRGDSALSLAAGAGKDDAVELLLLKKAQPDQANHGGRTPLAEAAAGGHLKTAGLLIASGAQVNAGAGTGEPALVVAAQRGDGALVGLLLEKKASADVTDRYGWTAFNHAASMGHAALAQRLRGGDGGQPPQPQPPMPSVPAPPRPEAATAPVYRSPVKPDAAPAGASVPAAQAAQDARLPTAPAATIKAATVTTTTTTAAAATPPASATVSSFPPPTGMTVDSSTILRKAAERNDPETLSRIMAAHPGERAAINEPIKFAYQRSPLPAGSYTLLMLAAARGHMPVVQALLALGADANAHGSDGMTALLLATRHGQVETVQALLKAGARVDAQAADGSTAVMLAFTQRDKAAVSALLPGVSNPEDSSACLREAASSGYLNTARLLLKAGAAVNGFEEVKGDGEKIWAYDRIQRALDKSSGESDRYEAKDQLRFYDDQGKLNPCARMEWANSLAVFRAARNGHASTVQALLDAGARLDRGCYSQQLMVDALKGEHTDIVRMLLEARQRASYPKDRDDCVASDMPGLFKVAIDYLKGDDPAVIQALLNLPGGKEAACKDPSVLVSAVRSGSCAKVKALLDAGVDPNTPNEREYPICLAVVGYGKKKDLLEMLIKAGARPELPRERGGDKTLLQHAAQYGDIALFRYLLSLGVAACGDKNDINAALGDVCYYSYDTANKAQMLFDAGADPNWKNRNGRIALHMAASGYGDEAGIQLLIKRKAQVDCADSAGQTPLMLAAKEGHVDRARLLLQAGADRNLKDRNGKTALQLAMDGQKKDTADLLRSWTPTASS
ncbi:ankyrin repeat domain-containing protein [Noviherbaspirillum sp. 1P10PC]|uniref:ankyrin repeat domain-containing protein n=1 Tax=Noviherbaspirillum sp. 1P10PC TaxID=3132292 RepID=UPI0039A16898